MTSMKEILLFGGTGLIGNELLQLLLQDASHDVKAFSRQPIMIEAPAPSFTNHVISFNRWEEYGALITGDVLFCCLGTTIRKAKSKEAFRNIDYKLVMRIAKIALENGVKKMLVISSIGADADSGNFYLKTKGEMERDLRALPFHQLKILRPSILTGNRKEFRLGEKIGIGLASLTSPLMMGALKKYRPIKAATVARAMLVLSKENSDRIIYDSEMLQEIGR